MKPLFIKYLLLVVWGINSFSNLQAQNGWSIHTEIAQAKFSTLLYRTGNFAPTIVKPIEYRALGLHYNHYVFSRWAIHGGVEFRKLRATTIHTDFRPFPPKEPINIRPTEYNLNTLHLIQFPLAISFDFFKTAYIKGILNYTLTQKTLSGTAWKTNRIGSQAGFNFSWSLGIRLPGKGWWVQAGYYTQQTQPQKFEGTRTKLKVNGLRLGVGARLKIKPAKGRALTK